MNPTFNRFSQWFLHHTSFAAYIEPVVQRFKPAWRANLFRTEVVNITAVHEDYLELLLKPEPTWSGFVAGQHIELTVEMNGRLLTRVFTIASDPNQFRQSGVIRLLMRVNRDGQFTRALYYSLKRGSWCNISAAKGEFVHQMSAKPVLLVAGGSGITPFLAMLPAMLDCQQQPVTLIYFAKSGSHVALDELRTLAGRFAHFYFQLAKRENIEVVETLIAVDPATNVYCCGPVGLMNKVRGFANHHQRTYYQEQFGLVQNLSSSPASEFQVKFEGQVVSTSNQTSLLNQLQAKQLPVTRGCGMGICHQCQCIKKSGVVRDLRTGERSAQGEMLIQLCVVVPESDLELSL